MWLRSSRSWVVPTIIPTPPMQQQTTTPSSTPILLFSSARYPRIPDKNTPLLKTRYITQVKYYYKKKKTEDFDVRAVLNLVQVWYLNLVKEWWKISMLLQYVLFSHEKLNCLRNFHSSQFLLAATVFLVPWILRLSQFLLAATVFLVPWILLHLKIFSNSFSKKCDIFLLVCGNVGIMIVNSKKPMFERFVLRLNMNYPIFSHNLCLAAILSHHSSSCIFLTLGW